MERTGCIGTARLGAERSGSEWHGAAVAEGLGADRIEGEGIGCIGKEWMGWECDGMERIGKERRGCKGRDRTGADQTGQECQGSAGTETLLQGDEAMVKHAYTRVLSKDLRHGNAKQRAGLLSWMNQAKFDNRKPTPEELIRECRRKKSPLYGLMKTDEKTAAEAYWRATAQDIIRHIQIVRIEVKTGKALTKPVNAWLPITIEKGGRIPEDSYVPTQRAMKSKTTRATILDRARREFEAWMDRWGRYDEFAKEFSPVLQAYRDLREKLEA